MARVRSERASWPSRPRPPEHDPFDDPLAVALVDVVAERGYEAATIEEIVERANVTRADFGRRFRDKEDCVQRCFEAFTEDWHFRIDSAYCAFVDWRTSLRAAAYEVADWMTENPNLVRFGMVEVLKAKNEMIRVIREDAVRYGADLVDRGRQSVADPAAVPDAAPLMAVGSIVQLLTHRLQTGVAVEPRNSVPPMMYMATRPYVGEEVAREEFGLPRPHPRAGHPTNVGSS